MDFCRWVYMVYRAAHRVFDEGICARSLDAVLPESLFWSR